MLLSNRVGMKDGCDYWDVGGCMVWSV